MELLSVPLAVPVGTIIDFAGPNDPEGYLECDGRSLSAADYPQLYAAIGATWGGGGISDPVTMSFCLGGEGLDCCEPDDQVTYLVRSDGYIMPTSFRSPCGECCSANQWDTRLNRWIAPSDIGDYPQWTNATSSGYQAALAQAQSTSQIFFNVPDLRGRVAIGSGTGTAGGATAHSLADKGGDQRMRSHSHGHSLKLPNHAHTMGHTHTMSHTHTIPYRTNTNIGSGSSGQWTTDPGTVTAYGGATGGSSAANTGGASTTNTGNPTTTPGISGSISSAGGGTQTEAEANMPPYAAVRKLIKAK